MIKGYSRLYAGVLVPAVHRNLCGIGDQIRSGTCKASTLIKLYYQHWRDGTVSRVLVSCVNNPDFILSIPYGPPSPNRSVP